MPQVLNTTKERCKFLASFLTNPLQIGSVTPSSKFLVARMLDKFDWERARLVIEYGPGTGCFTKEILQRLHPEAKLLAFEINDRLVAHMQQLTKNHPNCQIINRSAAEINDVLEEMGLEKADAIISGLPYSSMNKELRHEILQATSKALKPGHTFCAYQYSTVIKPIATKYFDNFTAELEPLNIPPAFVMQMNAKTTEQA